MKIFHQRKINSHRNYLTAGLRFHDFFFLKRKKNTMHAIFFFQPFFVERVFHIFDKDDNGSISLQEFIDAMHQFAGQSPDDKIKFLFKVYDIDGKFTKFRAILDNFWWPKICV